MPQNKIALPQRPEQGLSGPVHNYAVGRSFEIQNGTDKAEITLYDVIGENIWGEGVSARAFKGVLDKISASEIVLKINSPGGDVFDGIAIYNDLVDHPARVTVQVTGLAASAASVIAMAGEQIEMAANAHMMIHNAWVLAIGNKNVLREVADTLEGIDESLADTYEARTGAARTDIVALMNQEKWMRAKEAVELGFADAQMDKTDTEKAAFDVSMYAAAPVEVKRTIEGALREAGYTSTESKAAVNKGFQVLSRREAGAHDGPPPAREAGDALNVLSRQIHDLTASFQTH